MPIEPAITIIRRKLELDQELHKRTTMKVEQIISLLEFCLRTTYFQFQGRFYEQLQGAAMGLPSAPLWQTSTWRTLRSRPKVKLNILPESGRGMWMTLLSSFSLQGRRSFWNILTTWAHAFSSPLRMLNQMGPFLSWTQ